MRRKLLDLIQPVTLTFLFIPLLVFAWFIGFSADHPLYHIVFPFLALLGLNLVSYLLAEVFGHKLHPAFHCLILLALSAGLGYCLFMSGMKLLTVIIWCLASFIGAIWCSVRLFRGLLDMSVSHLAFGGLILFGINYLLCYFMSEGYSIGYAIDIMAQIQPFAVFWLLGTLWIVMLFHTYALNANRGRKTPRRVIVFNCVVTAVFTLLVIGVYYIDSLRQAMEFLLNSVSWLVGLIAALIGKIFSKEAETGEGGEGGGMGDIGAALGAEAHKDTLFDVIFMYIVEALVVILLIAAAGFLLFKLYQLLRFLAAKANGFLNSWESTNQSYIDEREDLMSADIFRNEMRERLDHLRNRFRRRPNLRDLPDDRARVRALYQWMLEKSAHRGQFDPAQTPMEYLSSKGQEGQDFARSYEAARYSEHTPDASAVSSGEKLYHRH